MMRLLRALSSDDIAGMFDGFTELLIAGQYSDLNRLRGEFYNEIERAERQHASSAAIEGSRVSLGLIAMLRTAHQNGFRVPPTVLSFCRRLLISETLAKQFSERANLVKRSKPMFDRLQVTRLIDALHLDSLQPVVLDSLNLISEGPRTVRRLLSDQVDGRLVLRVRTVESEEDRRESNARARLLTTATVSVGLSFLIGATRGYFLFGLFRLSWVLLLLLAFIWCWLILQWRNLR